MRSRTIAIVGIGTAALLLAPAVAHADDPSADAALAPSRTSGSTVARIVAPTFARARLRSPKRGWRVSTQTEWSAQAQTLLVLDTAAHEGREWVRVLLPHRPNGTAGWILRDRVELISNRYWIDVRIGARRVTVYRDGERLRRFLGVVGAPATPTPHGLAAVYEINRQPDPRGPIGPWALALTVHSNVLKSFAGGEGRVGIHGRGGATLGDPLGSARSHGCVRLATPDITWLAKTIPAGTPVRLRG